MSTHVAINQSLTTKIQIGVNQKTRKQKLCFVTMNPIYIYIIIYAKENSKYILQFPLVSIKYIQYSPFSFICRITFLKKQCKPRIA